MKMLNFNGQRRAGIRRLALAGLAATLGVLPGCDDNSEPNLPAIVPVPNSIAVADVSGSGVPDLLVAITADEGLAQNPGYASVILNTAGKLGTFQPGVNYPTTGTNPSSIALADLTGSGDLDLVVANFSSGSVSVFFHGCVSGTCAIGSFKPAVNVATGGMPNQVVIADLNGDGKPDLVLADMSANGNVIVLMANPSSPGQFAPAVNLHVGTAVTSVWVADLNGDGAPDIVAATSDAAGNNGAVYVFLQSATNRGTFAAPAVYPAGPQPQSVKIADVNGDTLPDIVVANLGPGSDGMGSNGVSVLLQDAKHPGTFLSPVTYATPAQAIDVAVSDLNDDGKPDLVVASLGPPPWGAVSVLLQDAAHPGVFLPATTYPGIAQPLSVVIADLNGDGHPDIAVADGISATVLFQNAAQPGTFAQPVQVGASTPPY